MVVVDSRKLLPFSFQFFTRLGSVFVEEVGDFRMFVLYVFIWLATMSANSIIYGVYQLFQAGWI